MHCFHCWELGLCHIQAGCAAGPSPPSSSEKRPDRLIFPVNKCFKNRFLFVLAGALWSRLSEKSGDWCEVRKPACQGYLSFWLFFGKGEDFNKCVTGFCFWKSDKCYFVKTLSTTLHENLRNKLTSSSLPPSKRSLDEAMRAAFLSLSNWSHVESRVRVRARFSEASDWWLTGWRWLTA